MIVAEMGEWLSNGRPPWAAYRALMSVRLIALEKSPGIRPVRIGETWRHLLAKCLLRVSGHHIDAYRSEERLCGEST